MSQGRMRNGAPLASNHNGFSTQVPVAKAADDSLIHNHRHKKDNQRSRSKNKLPKSVRYDLENALVGLCDVWFEEIKPHLVRNNIKLHIHGAASGDHERQQEPSAPTCSHVDPGAAPDCPQRAAASYASSCLMPPTASRVPCVKPQAYNRLKNQQPQPPMSLREYVHYVQNPRQICEDMRAQRPFKKRREKRRSFQCEARSNWRVSRPCRTSGIIPLAAKQLPKSWLINDNYSNIVLPHRHRKAVMMINKSTQTELSIPTGHVLSVSTQTHLHPDRTCSPLITEQRCSRREGTTLLSSPTTYHKQYQTPKDPVLFQDDLIDIISKKHEKRLKIIYNSPEQVDYSSLMYLMSSNRRTRKSRSPKTAPPWR